MKTFENEDKNYLKFEIGKLEEKDFWKIKKEDVLRKEILNHQDLFIEYLYNHDLRLEKKLKELKEQAKERLEYFIRPGLEDQPIEYIPRRLRKKLESDTWLQYYTNFIDNVDIILHNIYNGMISIVTVLLTQSGWNYKPDKIKRTYSENNLYIFLKKVLKKDDIDIYFNRVREHIKNVHLDSLKNDRSYNNTTKVVENLYKHFIKYFELG